MFFDPHPTVHITQNRYKIVLLFFCLSCSWKAILIWLRDTENTTQKFLNCKTIVHTYWCCLPKKISSQFCASEVHFSTLDTSSKQSTWVTTDHAWNKWGGLRVRPPGQQRCGGKGCTFLQKPHCSFSPEEKLTSHFTNLPSGGLQRCQTGPWQLLDHGVPSPGLQESTSNPSRK